MTIWPKQTDWPRRKELLLHGLRSECLCDVTRRLAGALFAVADRVLVGGRSKMSGRRATRVRLKQAADEMLKPSGRRPIWATAG